VQLCVDPPIGNFLSKTFHISPDSLNKKNQQVCTMLERQMIFACAASPNDIEKLFSKLQVSENILSFYLSSCYILMSAFSGSVLLMGDGRLGKQTEHSSNSSNIVVTAMVMFVQW